MRRSGCFTSRPICAAQGFAVEIYDSTFGSRDALFRILETEPPATLGIYANLMTRANALAILERAVAVRLAGGDGRSRAGQLCGAVSGRGRACRGFGRRRTRAGSDPAGRAAGADSRLVFSRRGRPRGQHRSGAIAARPGRAALAGPRTRRYRPVSATSGGNTTARGRCPSSPRAAVPIIAAGAAIPRSAKLTGAAPRRAVVDEVEWILNRYHPEQLWFADDVFTIHHGWLDQYAAEMRRRGLRVPFECITRADRLNARVAAQLAELGCDRVWIGSESGSQRLLDAMERGVTIAQVRDAVGAAQTERHTHRHVLHVGLRGRGPHGYRSYLRTCEGLPADVFFTTISYPIKGTPYYDEVAPKLVQLGAWQATTDRDIKIRGRRSRRFYQLADQLLRSETAAEAALVRQRLKTPTARWRHELRRVWGRRFRLPGCFRPHAPRATTRFGPTTAIGRAQRNLVWRDIDALFHAGERILDIGCGTGEDAAHFAARGVHVYATDASPAMVRVARERGSRPRCAAPKNSGESADRSMARSRISAR